MKKKLLIFSLLLLSISCSTGNDTSIFSSTPHISISIINPNISSSEYTSSDSSSSDASSYSNTSSSSDISSSSMEVSSYNEVSSKKEDSSSSLSVQTSSLNNISSNAKNYYDSIDFTKTGDSLKKELYELIKKCDMSKYTYNTCDSFIANANEDPNNSSNLIEFYTGRSVPKNYYPTSSSKPDAWNKEHVYAKSHGDFASQVAGKDIHHLMPTDNGVNAKRSNKDFDDCTSESNAVKTYKSYSQTITVKYSDPNDICYTTSNAFEPRDAVKGDVARILFYMATRYEGNNDGGPDLELVDNYTSGSAPTLGKLSTLKKWHELDPVDEFEMKRNDYIYSVQNNRNPYIDHPELVNIIF